MGRATEIITGDRSAPDGPLNEEQKEAAMTLSLEKAMEIQEALMPLGYMVHGYRDPRCTGNDLVTIDLRYIPSEKESRSEKKLQEALEAGYGKDDTSLSMDGVSESFNP
jgi:hypothetical protein